MLKINLVIKINIPELDSYSNTDQACPQSYRAKLFIESSKIEIVLSYPNLCGLYEKLRCWSENILDPHTGLVNLIEITESHSEYSIDFTNSKVLTVKPPIQMPNHKNEYELNIRFDKVMLQRQALESRIPKRNPSTTIFLFNADELFKSLNLYYYRFDNEHNTWQAKKNTDQKYFLNNVGSSMVEDALKIPPNDFISFGQVSVMIDYLFYSPSNRWDEDYVIKKRPIIRIDHEGVEDDLIEAYSKLLCSLLSLYNGQQISYWLLRIIKEKEVMDYYQSESLDQYQSYHKLHIFGFIGDIFSLLSSVKTEMIIDKVDSYSKFVNRFIWALTLEGESKFMLLYNVLEQIRNTLIDTSENNDEFEFTLGNKKTGKYIRDVLRSISKIVAEDQIEEFEKQVITHSNRIKYRPMTNQFDDLFIKLNLKLDDFDISFKELKDVRDDIFHGHPISEDDVRLIKANGILPKIVGRTLLLMVGIELDKPIKDEE